MPITQERMLALITAGSDYQQALQRACSIVHQAQKAVDNGANAELELARVAALVFESGLLKQPLTSHTLIALEEQHYRKEHFKNQRRRQYLASKRREAGIPQRITAPQSIQALKEISGASLSEQRQDTVLAAGAQELLENKFTGLDQGQKAQIEREAEQALREQEYLALQGQAREQARPNAALQPVPEEPGPAPDITPDDTID